MNIQDKIREYLGEGTEMGTIGNVDIKQFGMGKGELGIQLTGTNGYVQLNREEAAQLGARLAQWAGSQGAQQGEYEAVEEDLNELNAKSLFKTGFGSTGGGGSTPMKTTTGGGGSRALQTTGGNTTPKAVRQQHVNKRIAKARARVNNSIEAEAVEENDEQTKTIKVNKEIELAGDSIWDRDNLNPKSVMVDTVSIHDENDPDDVGEDMSYRMVNVQHNGPWTIYTDSGFEKAISDIVGFEVGFTEQGMQDDGMASMEGNIEEQIEETPVSNDLADIKRLAGL